MTSKFHIHWFKFKFQEGINLYYECRCGKRSVRQRACDRGYSPINEEWLENGKKIRKH